jgi:hypothetical protein
MAGFLRHARLAASIHVLNPPPTKEDVDGRDEPDHDEDAEAPFP